MNENLIKQLTIAVDGSATSLYPAVYLSSLFKGLENISLDLLYIEPVIPYLMVEQSEKDPDQRVWLRKIMENNRKNAEDILRKATDHFRKTGFSRERIHAVSAERVAGVAMDICFRAQNQNSDAIVISTHGKGKLEAFFMGETASKVVEASEICPVWLVKGKVQGKPSVLIGIDCSENSLRAVDHAAFILKGTNVRVILCHSGQNMTRSFPSEVFRAVPEAEKFYNEMERNKITPFINCARDMLIEKGFSPSQIIVHVIDGTRNTAQDILSSAEKYQCDTVILGKKGSSNSRSYSVGSLPKRVIDMGKDIALWIIP